MKKFPKFLLVFIAFGLFFTSCDLDDLIPDKYKPEPPKTAEDYPVQNFMWQAMNAYYFWQQDVPDLADDRFDGIEDPAYVDFLAQDEDPADFYYNRLLFLEDRFSFLNEDYKELVQSFQGVSKGNGLQFGLSLFGEGNDVFGYVEYIIENSNAATKDIKRGDLFVTVDGTQLFYNSPEDNNLDLLFEGNDTYTLGLADIVDNTIVPNDKEVTLTKEEGLLENPILISKVIESNDKKIGYIMYNGFVANYDDELNEAFAALKVENVKDLILDFRYNPGGRVSSAIQIASAVYGTNTDELFLKARYNDKIQSSLGEGQGESNFTDVTFDSQTPLTTLELERVFVITTGGTASASELVINGLEPYIDVIQVGTTTVGKNEFSVTFVDDPENDFFYDSDRESFINPDNQWAIQPLLGRNENADGFSDYTAGLAPDFELREDVANLGVLGEESDPLLALTLSQIFSETGKFSFDPVMPVKFVTSSQLANTKGSGMLMDGLTKSDF